VQEGAAALRQAQDRHATLEVRARETRALRHGIREGRGVRQHEPETARGEFAREDFEIVAVNVDEDPADAHAFLRKVTLSFPLLRDDGTLAGVFPNFTVEMETGTGKTYVYLRTAQELAKTYGFRKFVIVVPSIAIREGVLKSLQITREHFQTLYDYERMEFMVYDSAKVKQLRNFALSDAIQILVINIDAFAKDTSEASGDASKAKKKVKGNVINQVRETGVKPIEFIQATQPIAILDEP